MRVLSHFSGVWLCMIPWIVAHWAPLRMGFSRQEYWNGLLFPSPGDHPDPGIESKSPALQVDSLPTELWGNPDSVQFSRSVVSDSLWPYGLQHARLPCPSPIPWAYSNSRSLSRWCHPTISSSVIPFSSRLQSFPASGSFPMSQFFTTGGQIIGVSPSVLPMNIQDWFPLRWTGWISLQSKGLSRVLSNTTVQKHQFFVTQLYSPTLTSIHDYWIIHSFD